MFIFLYLTSPTGLPYFPEFDVDYHSTEIFPSSNGESVETSGAEFSRTRWCRLTPTLLQPSYRSVLYRFDQSAVLLSVLVSNHHLMHYGIGQV
jgi:hypothetical protein